MSGEFLNQTDNAFFFDHLVFSDQLILCFIVSATLLFLTVGFCRQFMPVIIRVTIYLVCNVPRYVTSYFRFWGPNSAYVLWYKSMKNSQEVAQRKGIATGVVLRSLYRGIQAQNSDKAYSLQINRSMSYELYTQLLWVIFTGAYLLFMSAVMCGGPILVLMNRNRHVEEGQDGMENGNVRRVMATPGTRALITIYEYMGSHWTLAVIRTGVILLSTTIFAMATIRTVFQLKDLLLMVVRALWTWHVESEAQIINHCNTLAIAQILQSEFKCSMRGVRQDIMLESNIAVREILTAYRMPGANAMILAQCLSRFTLKFDEERGLALHNKLLEMARQPHLPIAEIEELQRQVNEWTPKRPLMLQGQIAPGEGENRPAIQESPSDGGVQSAIAPRSEDETLRTPDAIAIRKITTNREPNPLPASEGPAPRGALTGEKSLESKKKD